MLNWDRARHTSSQKISTQNLWSVINWQPNPAWQNFPFDPQNINEFSTAATISTLTAAYWFFYYFKWVKSYLSVAPPCPTLSSSVSLTHKHNRPISQRACPLRQMFLMSPALGYPKNKGQRWDYKPNLSITNIDHSLCALLVFLLWMIISYLDTLTFNLKHQHKELLCLKPVQSCFLPHSTYF